MKSFTQLKLLLILFPLLMLFQCFDYVRYMNTPIVGQIGGKAWEAHYAIIYEKGEEKYSFYMVNSGPDYNWDFDPCSIVLQPDEQYYISGTIPVLDMLMYFKSGVDIYKNEDLKITFHANGKEYPAIEGFICLNWIHTSDNGDSITSFYLDFYAKANDQNKVVGSISFTICITR